MIKKRIFQVFKFLGSVFGILIILIFTLGDASSQVEEVADLPVHIVHYGPHEFEGKLDSLKAAFGKNKILPEGYELQALLALSHYPELRDVQIEFVLTETLIPLASRPKVFTKLSKAEKHKYEVIISTKSAAAMEDILLKSLPFNAQVGVLGHELGHTVYYLDRGFWDVLKIGINYLFPRYRAKFEKDTDRRTIKHGLGKQLYDWAEFIRRGPEQEGDSFVDKYYLTPAEIKLLMGE